MNAGRAAVRRVASALAAAFGGLTALVGVTQGAPVIFLVLDTTLGLAFVAAGYLAWELRPRLRSGPMLVASGVLWWVGSYAPTTLVPWSLLGFAFERYYDPLLALLVLTFPDARLSRWGAAAIGAMGTAVVVRTGSRLFVDCGCMPNPLALGGDIVLFDAFAVGTSAMIAAAAAGVALLALHRLASAPPGARRILSPVVAAGVVAALGAAWQAAELISFITTGEGLIRVGEPWQAILGWSPFVAVALVPLGFLLGTLRLRATRGPLASLAVELGDEPEPPRLESALRHALGDPDLELMIWDRDASTWRHAADGAPGTPVESAERAVTTIERGGGPIAAIVHDRTLNEDPGLLAAATAVLRLTIENERLTADVKRRLAEVQASRARLVEAAEAERRRIERNLHDGAQQRLIAVGLALQEARTGARLAEPNAGFLHRLDDAADELLAAIDELRELARGIHPAILSEEGLAAAVTSLARRAAVPVDVQLELDGRLPAAVETAAYYVVAEALTNVVRHARARSATVRLAVSGGRLQILVEDDGAGGADARAGTGLAGLADRLDAVAGTLEVQSLPGQGTRLRASIPCA